MIRDAWEALSRALAVVRRRKLDREFDEEFATHLELLTEQNERSGLPRHEARRQAILQMGGLKPTRDFHRASRGLPALEQFLETTQAVGKDFRHAARSLARARAFTLVCAISLGVGMGAFVALVTFYRAMTSPARGIDTNGLVELLVTPARAAARQSRCGGHRRVVVSRFPGGTTDRYRDGGDGLGDGLNRGRRPGGGHVRSRSGRESRACADALRVGELLQHVRRFAGARPGIRPGCRRPAVGPAPRRRQPSLLAEQAEL